MRDLAVLFKGNNPARLLGGLGVTLKLSLISVALRVRSLLSSRLMPTVTSPDPIMEAIPEPPETM